MSLFDTRYSVFGALLFLMGGIVFTFFRYYSTQGEHLKKVRLLHKNDL